MGETETGTRIDERLFLFGDVNAGQALTTPRQTKLETVFADRRRRAEWGTPAAIADGAGRAVHALLAQEVERGTFFLFLPVFIGSGAVLYFCATSEPRLSAILCGLTVLVGLFWTADGRPVLRRALMVAIAIVTGMTCGKLETLRADTTMLASDVTTRVTGRIVAMARGERGTWRITLDVLATERPALRYSPERIAVSGRALPANLHIGDGLKGLVHLRSQHGPLRPGNYDFAFNNYYRGIGANGFFLGKPEAAAVPPPTGYATAIWQIVARMRQQLTARILTRIDGEPGEVAASQITGERDGISEATNDAMRVSGLSHILSISGFHMALVAAIIVGSLRAVMAVFPTFSARYPVKKLAALLAMVGSAFYLMLSGADVAAQRSFVMLAVMLLAVIFDRAAISMRNLAIAASITIVVMPHEILGPSFQMSYSATGALIAFHRWWSSRQEKRARPRNDVGFLLALPATAARHIGDIALTSFVAGTASSIYAVYHFNNAAPLGVLGNALALPVVSILVMPFAVLALLAMPFDLDWLPFAIMERGIKIVIDIAKFVSEHSPGGSIGQIPQASFILLSIGLILLMLMTTRLRVCGIALMAMAVLPIMMKQGPDIVIAEEGNLVALRTSERSLAINRATGSAFILDNWQEGYGSVQLLKPLKDDSSINEVQFECNDALCLAREPGGLIIAYTDKPAKKSSACAEGDIVILAFAGHDPGCRESGILVITKQTLALHGAVEITLGSIRRSESGTTDTAMNNADQLLKERLQSAKVNYAVGQADRPWNSYRVHSRSARNIAERPKGSDHHDDRPL